jgi:hypothetical protein
MTNFDKHSDSFYSVPNVTDVGIERFAFTYLLIVSPFESRKVKTLF